MGQLRVGCASGLLRVAQGSRTRLRSAVIHMLIQNGSLAPTISRRVGEGLRWSHYASLATSYIIAPHTTGFASNGCVKSHVLGGKLQAALLEARRASCARRLAQHLGHAGHHGHGRARGHQRAVDGDGAGRLVGPQPLAAAWTSGLTVQIMEQTPADARAAPSASGPTDMATEKLLRRRNARATHRLTTR
eukprot:scaffold7588_cov133-Isochrysis_galbana.AAC.3